MGPGAPELLSQFGAALAGRYRIGHAVGAGGMSIVFQAEDLKHARPVAIKILKPELASVVWSGRFLREIQIASRLQHPHILPLYDSGEVLGVFYYVMPYIAGESLRARLVREAALPVTEALRLAGEVAEGLSYAHAQGVVHRDIKPENILLSGGHVLICDFGIARALSLAAGDTPTEPGLVIGTPAYMSPEQSFGAADLDARTDIYSLGCVLYEMLAGQPPFSGPTAVAFRAQHAASRPPSVRRLRKEVPPGVDAALGRAMAKQSSDRFGSAAEFAEAFDLAKITPPVVVAASVAPAAIAVLPFANLSANPDHEYLSDGISEELMQALCGIDQLRVVARTSAFAFKGKREDVREIGERLRVDVVLDGSVRVVGDRVKIAVQLVDTSDGYQRWSAQYERQVGDTLSLEDEIARTIVEVLRSQLTGSGKAAATSSASPPPRPPRDPQAHESYLRGRFYWNRRTEHGITRSIGCFEQAIARAPNDAAIYAALADSYLMRGIYGTAPADDVMPKARTAAERALKLDPRSAEAHTALACVRSLYEWSWRAAEDHFRLAVELKPGYPVAHQWAAMHLWAPLAQFDEARASLERARELDPLSPAILTSLGVVSFLGRDYDRACRELEDVIDLDSGFAPAHYFLGQVQLWRSEHNLACDTLARAVTLAGGSTETRAGLAYAHAVAGREAEARATVDDLTRCAETTYVSPLRMAQIHLGLGERAEALLWLDRALDQRAADAIWIGVHPMFDVLREEPRFAAALGRVGLSEPATDTRVRFSSRPPPISASRRT